MVESSADAADDDDLACTAFQCVFYAEHGVRVVLDRGEAENLLVCGELVLVLDVVKISDYGVRHNAFRLSRQIRGVRAYDKVGIRNIDDLADRIEKIGRNDDGFHKSSFIRCFFCLRLSLRAGRQ